MQEVILTEEELRIRCTEWQKILRLQDWIVVLEIKRGRDMPINNVCGSCSWELTQKMAAISILDPIDYPPDSIAPNDMELTLVHELLHLHFCSIEPDGASVAGEQAIESISWGLIALARRGGETKNENANLRRDGGVEG
ncbi:hypothetical protein J41TS12_10720 [Paenibacillus antibioticophila]|uniref:Uncharacterized protein n=1 Tax=Paenibacillus antibioticophila TaxID=1274374 RepID=A0A919XPV5_9BACL|nr:hypothetical protein [Paenibacillus antibioticophila]GIO36211.1 hypothetical protein J41TS12_10720 [Paenibacillus antibioticophila]